MVGSTEAEGLSKSQASITTERLLNITNQYGGKILTL